LSSHKNTVTRGFYQSKIPFLVSLFHPFVNIQHFWFTAILDKGINSLRDLFYQLNHTSTQVDLSTFSKANKTRDPQIFMRLYHKLLRYIEQAYPEKKLVLCPFDATVIPLMSKLFWLHPY
jgi:putative transposase